VLYRLFLVVVIWRKMNGNEVDSDSEIDEAMTDTPPDIADEASVAKQDLLPKKSGDLLCITLKMSTIESKASKTFSLYLVNYFLLHHCS
jgi:hypothetical protein